MQSFLRDFFGRPYLLLTLTSLFWAGNIVLGRYAAGHVPPLALSFVRWCGAFLILIGFAWPLLRRDWSKIRSHLGVLLLLTLSGITIYNWLAYSALQYTQALNALLIASMQPLLVACWSMILYRERLTKWQALGVALSLLGVLVVIARGDLSILKDVRFNYGDLAFFVAQTVYAFYSTLLKSRPSIHPLSFLTFTIGMGAVMLSPAYIYTWPESSFPLDWKSAAILGYITLFPSLVAYLFFNRGVELVGPNRAAPFYHLIPVFGSALAIIFLGERPALFHAIGYALVLCGIYIGTRGQAKSA